MLLDLPESTEAPAPPLALFEAAAATEVGARLLAALHSRQGREITPMLAAALVAETCFGGEPINLRQFPAELYSGYMIQAERFESIVHELHPLHEAHWQETEKGRHGLPFTPDYDAAIADERAGKLLQFTVRDGDWRLVGNLRMYLGTSRHTRTLFAHEDTLYVAPEVRGGMLACRLVRYAQAAVRSIGVREIEADVKLRLDQGVGSATLLGLIRRLGGALLYRVGFTPVAIKFTKVFED